MFPITYAPYTGHHYYDQRYHSPESGLATWSSIIPFFSPIVMMARIPFGVPGTVPWWQFGAQYDIARGRVPVYHLAQRQNLPHGHPDVWQKDYLERRCGNGAPGRVRPTGALRTCFLLRFFTTEDTKVFSQRAQSFCVDFKGHKGACGAYCAAIPLCPLKGKRRTGLCALCEKTFVSSVVKQTAPPGALPRIPHPPLKILLKFSPSHPSMQHFTKTIVFLYE